MNVLRISLIFLVLFDSLSNYILLVSHGSNFFTFLIEFIDELFDKLVGFGHLMINDLHGFCSVTSFTLLKLLQ